MISNEHIRNKAIELRKHGYIYDDIMKMLNVSSKSLLSYWFKDLNIPRQNTQRSIENTKRAGLIQREKHRLKREEYYNIGYDECKHLISDPLFRDFVTIYMCEGYRKSRHCLAVANSNSNIIKLSYKIIRRFINKKFDFLIQYHRDQDVDVLKEFWTNELNISIDDIKIQRKSNSGKMKGRKWNSKYGVFTIRINSTELRCRLQGWMDYVMETWGYGRPEVSPYIGIYEVSNDSEFDKAS